MKNKYYVKGSRNNAFWDDTAITVLAGPFRKEGRAESFMTKYALLQEEFPEMQNEFKVSDLFISDLGY